MTMEINGTLVVTLLPRGNGTLLDGGRAALYNGQCNPEGMSCVGYTTAPTNDGEQEATLERQVTAGETFMLAVVKNQIRMDNNWTEPVVVQVRIDPADNDDDTTPTPMPSLGINYFQGGVVRISVVSIIVGNLMMLLD
mmetsp:Transcript_942/g.1976  ORF Transcript_942/g.1976 Transcript_942/m.1976 type:complete len:138 (+) Transcript_942:138-551(+)